MNGAVNYFAFPLPLSNLLSYLRIIGKEELSGQVLQGYCKNNNKIPLCTLKPGWMSDCAFILLCKSKVYIDKAVFKGKSC